MSVYNLTINNLNENQIIHKNNLIYYNRAVPKHIKEVIDSIKEDLIDFYKTLEPCINLGLKFNLYLVGGSLRDLILNNDNKIKDLDILVSIDYTSFNNFSIIYKINKEKLEEIFDNTISLEDWNLFNVSKKIVMILRHYINKKYSISKEHYFFNIDSEGDYDMLNNDAVLTLKKDNNNFPKDILFSAWNFQTYINKFSLNISKIYFPIYINELINSSLTNEIPNFFLEELNLDSEFINDSMNKTITLDMTKYYNIGTIQKVFEQYYKRISLKYPQYKLIMIDGNIEEYKSYKEKIELYRSLTSNIKINEQNIKSKQIKV